MNIKDYKKVYNNLKTSTYMDEQILNSVEGNHKTKKNWSFSKLLLWHLPALHYQQVQFPPLATHFTWIPM